MPALSRRQIETVIAALVAIAAAIVGITTRESTRALGPKFITVQRIARLKEPVYLTQPPGPGPQLYIVQRQGAVRIVAADRLLPRPFLKLHGLVNPNASGETGLSSVAFPPDYARSGLFYVAYTDRRNALRVVEYRRSAQNPLVADPASARPVISIPEPTSNRHGGLIAFGPDGYLYFGAGDGSPAGDLRYFAQNKKLLLGKILRIDPAASGSRPYSVPADNPFVGRPGRDEIWAFGLSDPRSFSFDRSTHTIGIADVGGLRFEEIEFLPVAKARGANFGWPAYDGPAPAKGGVPRAETVLPAIAYPRRHGCTVIGGYLARDPRLARIRGRELLGRYLYANRCTGKLYGFRPRPGQAPGKLQSFGFRFRYLNSFGEDGNARIYLLTDKGPARHGKPTLGSVYRLVPNRKEISG
ncbi:MAG: PQQ-dependent sugar dehydrogenase [Solirubrobacterales bacterium]